MSKTAMKLALDALEESAQDSAELVAQYVESYGENHRPERLAAMRKTVCDGEAAIHALRQALAEPGQPARVPLTIEKIEACMKRAYAAAAGSRNLEICFAREIEAAHGITAQHASVPFLPGEYENTLLKTEKARKQL